MESGFARGVRDTPVSLAGAVAAALTSAAASICCIGPAGIALLGVNGAILAAGLKPYRTLLLTGSAGLLVLAFWSARRREAAACPRRLSRTHRVLLWGSVAFWFVALAIQFAADRYWL